MTWRRWTYPLAYWLIGNALLFAVLPEHGAWVAFDWIFGTTLAMACIATFSFQVYCGAKALILLQHSGTE